jgi:hypothetical protein
MSTVGPDGVQPFSGLEDSSVDATVLRMVLGSQLRRFREAAGITPEQAGNENRRNRPVTGGPRMAQLDPSAPEPKYLRVPEEETTHGPWV